jgi:outer membrane protein TolC
VSLAGTLAETPAASLLDGASQVNLATHASVAAAQAALEQATLEHRRARLEPYPDLRVGVAGGRLGDTGDSIVEFRIILPLPLIDRAKGRRQESRANAAVARAEMDVVHQQLLRRRADTVQRYRTAIEQVTRYREQILPKAAEALRLVQTGFEQGKFTFIDWVDTQRTVAEARLAYQQRLLEMNVAQAELEAFVIPDPSFIHPQTGDKP